MANFLEERLPIKVRMGARYADEYNVEITQVGGGAEYRRLVHPYSVRHFTIHYTMETADLWSQVVALYARAYGMYAGFRVKHIDDYSTNGNTLTPTPFDQPMLYISAGVYQLQKKYGAGATPLSIGLPVRTIFKPVTGTVRVGGASSVEFSGLTVDTTTGRVTFPANKTKSITAITKAASAVVTVGAHTFLVNESVYFSGVGGMTQINGLRGVITAVGATTITVNINSTSYSTWTSGGTAQTQPPVAEVVTAGCEFDIPCRFNSRIDIEHSSAYLRDAGDVDLIELLNP